MVISHTAEYALRAAMYLASRPDAALTTVQIAAATRVPAGYLSKVLQALGRAGLVHAQRGLHGGFVLLRPGSVLTVLDVVNAVDPIKRLKRCPLGIPGHASELCPLHRRLDEATALVEEAFAGTTIAELLTEPATSQPLGHSQERCTAADTGGR